METVGIVMRTKNRPILLKRAFQSVIGQTYPHWSLCIVNDGGDPAPVNALLESIESGIRPQINCIHHPESVGMEATSNAGLRALDSDYLLIHDDDDSLHPDFFAKTVNYLNDPPHPSVKGVVTKTERVIETIDQDTVTIKRRFPYNPWLEQISLRRMLVGNLFAPIAFLFSREAFNEVGGYREDLPVLGDWDFNVRFLQRFEIGMFPECLAYYHDREAIGDSDYASTIQAKAHLHQFYDNMLRNEWLRDDIKQGKTGAGMIANLALMHGDLAWQIKDSNKSRKRSFLPWKR